MLFSRVRADQLAQFFRALHALLHAGVGLSFALSSLGEGKSAPALRRPALEMSRLVAAGHAWSAALERFPTLFSKLTVATIRAAETGGFLERACLLLAENFEREYQLQQLIKREAWYPKILLFVSTIVVPLPLPLGIGRGAIPVSAATQILVLVGAWSVWKAANWGWPLGARDGAVRLFIDGKRLQIPLVGKVIRALATAKFCRFLGQTYAAGISLPRGVELAAAACGNGVLAREFAAIVPDLERGASLTGAIIGTGALPKIVAPLLQSGEMSGDLNPQLQAAARFLESDAETALRQSILAASLLVFLLVAVKIGLQVIGFWAGGVV